MKKFKVLSSVIAFALIFSLSMPAFAADNSVAETAFASQSSNTYNAASTVKGISVNLDGKNLDFSDTAPQNVKNHIMVPVRAILEDMGATVEYDVASQKVTAILNDTTISFFVGKNEITVQNGSETTKKIMDVVPFVDTNNHTLVPVRFMAESFGLFVSWDSLNQTVVLIDKEKLAAKIDENLTIFNKLFTNPYDMDKVYNILGDFDLKLSSPLLGDGTAVSMTGDITGLMQGYNVDYDMSMSMNLSDTLKSMMLLGSNDQAAAQVNKMLESIKNMTVQYKLNGKDMIVYMKMPFFSQLGLTDLSGNPLDEDTWFKIDYNKMSSLLNTTANTTVPSFDYSGLMERAYSGTMTMGSLVSDLLDSFSVGSDVSLYSNLDQSMTVLKGFVGDDKFTKTTSAGNTIYSTKINISEIENVNVTANLIITLNNDKLKGFSLNGTVNGAVDDQDFSLTINSTYSNNNSEVSMTVTVPDLFYLTLTSTSEMTANHTVTSVNTVPSSSDKIIDYFELLKNLSNLEK